MDQEEEIKHIKKVLVLFFTIHGYDKFADEITEGPQ